MLKLCLAVHDFSSTKKHGSMLKLCPAMVAVYDFRLAKKMHKLSEGHISNISNKQFHQTCVLAKKICEISANQKV
jgi:hypothetical protein